MSDWSDGSDTSDTFDTYDTSDPGSHVLDTTTTFLTGPKLGVFLSRVWLRAARRLVRERGAPRAVGDLARHLFREAGIPGALPLRLVRHGAGVWAVPDLPPLTSEAFLDCLIAGLDGYPRGPVTAILSLTARCPHHCPYCYVRPPGDGQDEPSVDLLASTVEGLFALGVRTFHLSGGEPALRCEDVLELVGRFQGRPLHFWLLTTGVGLDGGRLRALAGAGLSGLMVGLDADDASPAGRIKKTPGAHAAAVRALSGAREVGLLVAVNTVMTRPLLEETAFLRFLDELGHHGASFVNCYPPRTQGVLRPEELEPFTVEDQLRLHHLARRVNLSSRPRPLVYTPDVWEAYRGCQGGRSFLYVDPAGEVRRCPFLARSYGRIQDGDVAGILAAMRADPDPEVCDGHRQLVAALRARRRDGSVSRMERR